VEETDAKWRARQSGQDRQINAIQRELETSRAATAEQMRLTRESMLNREGLTQEEKATLQKTWELDDREKVVTELSDSTLDLHADVEVVLLLEAYKGVPGVTEEALQGLAQEEREGFCKDQKIAHLESGGNPAAAATNGAAQPAPAPAAATPPPAAPAGVSAPSDVGGAGVPPPAVTKNENPGADAMADNIGNTGWQDVSVRSMSGRR
jgi:hypothetical protein